MTWQPPDIVQRKLAIQPGQSFIVQAPAGSGKTGLLIQRYLRLLALVDAPEEIIAITFTRKAAAEMQGRILDALNHAASGHSTDKEYEQKTIDLAAIALKHSQGRDWQLIDNPGRLRIQTIDSFCAGLIRQMPLLSQTGGMQDIIENPGTLYERAAEASLLELESGQNWSDSISRLLTHLDNDLPRLKSLLMDMLQKRDQWLRYIVEGYRRTNLEQALSNLLIEKFSRIRAMFPAKLEAEFCEMLRFASANLAAVNSESNILACAGIRNLPQVKPQDRTLWCGIAEILVTKKSTWRVKLDKTIGFPAADRKAPDADEYPRMKKRMKAVIARLRRIEGLESALAELKILPPLYISEYEWEVVDALCQLLKLTAGQLQLLFNERNQQDFIGISQSALTALGSDDAPTDLAMYLDYQIRHILVDEFQDISVNQHDLIKRLTAGWVDEDGRTVFLVGDPMQSIYRFREAEVGNFIHTFHHQQFGPVSLHALVLSANFRSEAGIVDWVNHSFENIFAYTDDLATGAVSFHSSAPTISSDEEKNIYIHPFLNDRGIDEAESVVSIIRSIKKSKTKDSIAILVRNRNHLTQIIPRLRDAGIAYHAIDIEALGNKPAIQDVLALTRAWFCTADRTAWLSVLRAPWCGIDFKSLLLLAGADRHGLIWDSLRQADTLAKLDVDTRERVNRLMMVFETANTNRHRQTVRQSIESVWCCLGGPATVENESDLKDVISYFELLDSLDRGGEIEDMQGLMQAVADLFGQAANQGQENSVQVMTMHKAKGLEFDHVILPGLGRPPRAPRNELMKWMLRPYEDGGHHLFIGAIKETGQDLSPVYQYIKHIEIQKDNYEEQRLLYVSATRAKKALHLMGSAKLKQNKGGGQECTVAPRSLLKYLWPTFEDSFVSLMASPPQARTITHSTANRQLRRLKSSWCLPELVVATNAIFDKTHVDVVLDMDQVEYEWAGETIKRVGTVVHKSIQWMATNGAAAWDEKRIINYADNYQYMLKQAGLSGVELKRACKQVIAALSRMLKDDRGKWILADEHEEQRNELTVTGFYKHKLVTAIIDRTFIDQEGVRWIIDYKSSSHEGPDLELFLDREQQRYADQLDKYGGLMAALDPRPIKLGLYYPLLQGWREWDFEQR